MRVSRSSLLAATMGLALGGLAAGSVGAAPATWAEARALAAKENKPLLVDFFTEW